MIANNSMVISWLSQLPSDASSDYVEGSCAPPVSAKRKWEITPESGRKCFAGHREPLQITDANAIPSAADDPDGSPSRRQCPQKPLPPLRTRPSRRKPVSIRPEKATEREEGRGRSQEAVASSPPDQGTQSYGRSLTQPSVLIPPPTLSSGISKSTGASRSSSPTKTMADLLLAKPPIRFVEAGGERDDPPIEVSSLHRQFLGICDGFGALPGSLKKSIKAHLKDIESTHDIYFDGSASPPTEEQLRLWEIVLEIRENARSCNEDGDAEPGWSDMVYSRLLDVSLRYSQLNHRIGFKNITVATIEPKSLLPEHVSGKSFGARMVDYALILLPDERLRTGIRHALKGLADEDCNMNQTKYAPVRYNPITVNIKVKPPGSGRNDTIVQLAIWVAAQFNKLNSLNDRGATITIPLVWVEGHDWSIFIAFQNASGELTIRGGPPFGRTASVLGIYQIIRGIQLLADWSDTVYRPWLEMNILQLAAKGMS